MGSDWDEIKRLAADFQKVQLTSTLQRLSERNCVEIVSLLLQKQLVQVVFTNDGKDYITPEHLEREIQDELFVNGGRVHLDEISKSLNVDYTKIEEIAQKISNANPSIHFMLGQLIDDEYILRIAQEINEKLAQLGELTVSDLTQQFDLPSDFLQQNVCEKHLGKVIRGRQDQNNPRVFFTQAYLQRCKAKIRGALVALTRPINISTICQQIHVQEKLFHTLFDEISPAGYVTSKLANGQYVPHIYSKMQLDWINSFYKQNGYLEYEAVSKLGISNAKQFINKNFPNEEMVYLKRYCFGSKIIDLTVLTALNECQAAKSYVDLSTILPTNLDISDIEELFNTIYKDKTKNNFNNLIILNGVVLSKDFINELIKPCHMLVHNLAKTAVSDGSYQKYLANKILAAKSQGDDSENLGKIDKREERRKKASSGKAGGGAQGRETKTKSVKKHARGGTKANYNSDDEDSHEAMDKKKVTNTLELVSLDDILKVINKPLDDEGLDYLAQEIAESHLSQLNEIALMEAHTIYESTTQTDRRQTHAAIQEKINNLYTDIRLYEKGLKLFPEDVQIQLVKYLLKSLGNDICNELTVYIAQECNLTLKQNNLNVDQRIKIAQDCGGEYKSALVDLNKSLNGSVDDFLLCTENALKACSMILKKADKKKDKLLITQHKEKLLEELQNSNDGPLVLHLTLLTLFTCISGCMLHASGKFVSHILQYVRPHLNSEQNTLLQQYHDLILSFLQSNEDTNEIKTLREQLFNQQAKIKDLAQNYIKTTKTSTTHIEGE